MNHSLISATVNCGDIGINIVKKFGHIMIRLRKDSEKIVESHQISPNFNKISHMLIQVLYYNFLSDDEFHNVIVIQEDEKYDFKF